MRLTLFYKINNDELSIKLSDSGIHKINKSTRVGSLFDPYAIFLLFI